MVCGRKKLFALLLLTLLSALFGFCFLAIVSRAFTVPKEPYRLHTQRVLPEPQQYQKARAAKRRVVWNLFGDKTLQNVLPWKEYRRIFPRPITYLDTVSKGFQKNMLNGIPLRCSSIASKKPGSKDSTLLPKKYERFLKTLEEYRTLHGALSRDHAPSRTLVWWCSTFEYCGGLAQRLQGVTYALILAMITRRRLLIVWGDNYSESIYLHPYLIGWSNKTVTDSLIHRVRKDVVGSDDFANPYLIAFNTLIEYGKETIDIPTDDLEYYLNIIGGNETNIILSTNFVPASLLDRERNGNDLEWLVAGLQWHGLSNLSGQELDDLVGIAFRYLFKMDKLIYRELAAAGRTLKLTRTPYVAVHVRTGFADTPPYEELVSHPKLQQNDSEWRATLECAVKVANSFPGKNNTYIYLATDSKLVKQIALSKYGMRIRTLNNILLHVDRLDKDPHPIWADETEGLLVVWVEFLLLSRSRIMVRGDSSFAEVAGLLCGMYNGSMNVKHVYDCS